LLHVAGDLSHLKVKDIKTIKGVTKTYWKNPWQKKETRWWRRRRRNVEQEINSMGARVLADVGCAPFD
jgi:hypothetical protein